ncbi:hypothetical protein Tco_0330379, partial [Tanacetum coccineum]
SKEEHEVHVKLVLESLRKAKLYVMFSKCEFWLEEVTWSTIRIHMDPSKSEAVRNWMIILRIGRLLSTFIVIFFRLLNPRTSLTERNQKYEWSVEQEEAFQILKNDLHDTPIKRM